MKKKKSLVGWTWKRWDFWFIYNNGFLQFPETIRNHKVKCLASNSRNKKVRITIEEV